AGGLAAQDLGVFRIEDELVLADAEDELVEERGRERGAGMHGAAATAALENNRRERIIHAAGHPGRAALVVGLRLGIGIVGQTHVHLEVRARRIIGTDNFGV